ncbi:Ada metal-binding domain-containing protein [Lactobacillus sp. YT155]|uniref:Ada metal-binding domain-containing protein n=1 Tax=Lactobacillus sp. YT155 TaxID=3060955 RepID=UPI00265ECBE7|nr:Ada metal-binding domain-containing protein [Lactobacillus sp. YT155]MDO1604476.1 Ada metal-binding domain-containing protein [Lactobacillus sp. YT155]
MSQHRLTEKRWQAIQENNKEYDSQFVYGLKDSKIFCVPSCQYEVEQKEAIELFDNAQEARNNGYLPCKKCRPMGDVATDEDWAKEVKNIVKLNYQKDLNLESIAKMAHGAPYYLHHKFKETTGNTPLDELIKIRISKSKKLLKTSTLTIPEVAKQVGINNPAYFSTLFKKEVGQSPLKFRKEHPNNQLSELLKNISLDLKNY